MSPLALWVLVPLKNLGRAKERLSGALASLARRELVEAMARDVIEALQAVPVAPAHIVLVSDDDDVAARAAQLRGLIGAHLAALEARGAPLATLVTDRAGEGSNCLLSTPPDAVPYRFGAGSRARHHEAARAAGVRCVEHHAAGLDRDIDQPEDLAELVAICQSAENAGGAHTTRLLLRRGSEGNGPTF